MTKDELLSRLQDIEWDDFEVKEAKSELPKSIWETVSAFCNTSGGWIVLGVAQQGKHFEVTGVGNIEKLEQDFFGVLRSQKFNATLTSKAYRYTINSKTVLAFSFLHLHKTYLFQHTYQYVYPVWKWRSTCYT